jgi:hypothetical protein
LQKDATPTCGGWKKDPSRKFYLALHLVFQKLRNALSEGDEPTDFATCRYEGNLKLFMPAHLDYILLREFQRIRQGEETGDLPIVWATAPWRQTHHARKAILIRFEPAQELNAHTETLTTEIQTPPTDPALLPITKDQFWTVVSSRNPTVSLQQVLSLRFLLHAISSAHRNQTGLTWSGNGIAKFYQKLTITTGIQARIFFDDHEKLINFFKNRIFFNVDSRKRKPDHGTGSQLAQLKSKFLSEESTKHVWEVVFRHVDYAQVERILVAALGRVIDPNLPDFPIFDDPGSPTCLAIDSLLPSIDSSLGAACELAAGEGTLTVKLIQGLAKLRIDWQKNRLIFGTAYKGPVNNEDATDYNLNTALAVANGFTTKFAKMHLSKIGGQIVRETVVGTESPSI